MAAALAETAHLNADSKLENGSRKRRGINTPAQSRHTDTLVIFDALGQATQRARAVGRVRIVESILDDKDWRARAWYLERTAPQEFGRTADRPLPAEEDDDKRISVAIIANNDALDRIHEQNRKIVEALDRLPPGTTINSFTGDVKSGPKSKASGEDEPEMRYNCATRRFEPSMSMKLTNEFPRVGAMLHAHPPFLASPGGLRNYPLSALRVVQ